MAALETAIPAQWAGLVRSRSTLLPRCWIPVTPGNVFRFHPNGHRSLGGGSMNDALTAALAYAAQGVPVFPCNPANKQPYTPNGFKAATLNSSKVEDWWSKYPTAMIGMPTGAVSGFWV